MKTQRIISFITLAAAAGAGSACTEEAAFPYPSTCAEVKADNPAAVDAEYDLYVGNDPGKPWRAYCDGMGTNEPVEFLPLKRTDGNYNYSEVVNVTGGGFEPDGVTPIPQTPQKVRTNFEKLRIDPTDLTIDIGDRHHASKTGTANIGTQVVDGVAVGVTAVCNSAVDALATSQGSRGNIDLSGTRFAIDTEFCLTGTNGTATPSSDDGRIDLSMNLLAGAVSGACAFAAPDPCPSDAWRSDTDGFLLQLSYTP